MYVCVGWFEGGGGGGRGLRWAGGTNLSKKTMSVCVGEWGKLAEMGRSYQPIKENNVCVCVGGWRESGAEMCRRDQPIKENT